MDIYIYIFSGYPGIYWAYPGGYHEFFLQCISVSWACFIMSIQGIVS